MESRTPARPDPRRLTILAMKVIEEAAELAMPEPIVPAVGVRLALAWLTFRGVAKSWQVDAFWDALRSPPDPILGTGNGGGQYCRQRDLRTYVNAWKYVAAEQG